MKNTTKKLAIGTMIAAGAGYLAGLLTAPKSGKETRGDIKNAAAKAKAEAEKKLKGLHSELDGLINKAKSEIGKTKQKASKELVDATAKAQLAKEKARELLSALHDGYADDKELDKALTNAKKSIDHLKKFINVK